MVKKSKHFENLNVLKADKAENIILKEFIKNINSHIGYLNENFPRFWENFYCDHFNKEITISNLNSKESKNTIEILRVLFGKFDITNEKLDNKYTNKYKNNNLFCFYEDNFFNLNIQKLDIKEIADFFNYSIRAERSYRKHLAYLAPDGFEYFEKIKKEVMLVVLEKNYLNLGKLNINFNDLLIQKKQFLKKKGIKPVNIYLFYNEFDTFCKKFIHAKGLKSIDENIKIIYQGASYESRIQVLQNFFYKSFLTYLALEQLLIAASRLGKELYGSPKNHLSDQGSSVVRYQSHFLDLKLSNEIRNIPILQNMQYQDFFSFKDTHNKDLFSSFMNGDSHSLLIPLIIFRYFFVNGEAIIYNLSQHKTFLVSSSEEATIFKMNSLILNWCSNKFKTCMKFYK